MTRWYANDVTTSSRRELRTNHVIQILGKDKTWNQVIPHIYGAKYELVISGLEVKQGVAKVKAMSKFCVIRVAERTTNLGGHK